ncbi:MAG: hypothetical protein AABY22_06125 [Nanoarchaeota archaeon]
MISQENLQTIKARPEFQELLKYLKEELEKINTFADLEVMPIAELTPIVLARLEAFKVLKRILEPLIDIPDLAPKSKLDSYEVE